MFDLVPVMSEKFIQAAALGQSAAGEHFVENLAKSLVRLSGFLLDRVPGFATVSEFFSEEVTLPGLTSVVLLVLLFVLHAVIFSLLRRYAKRRRKQQGNKDAWALILLAAGAPLKLAFWVYGIYFATLPLLLLVQPDHVAYPVRLFFERFLGVGLFAGLYWFFYRSIRVGEVRLRLWMGTAPGSFQEAIIHFIGKALRIVVPVAAVILGLPLLDLPPAYDLFIGKASSLLIVGAVTWMLYQLVDVGERFVITRYRVTEADNLRARQVYTQAHILRKTLYVIITVFAVASALMLFDQVRTLGTSVLASAGVLGIIIGVAAQRTIANLFAGFQLALTQPIRLDDVVIVEKEWGRIEEITLTYVVVNIWDMRRLVVPLSYFIEHPFENWTRKRADLIGSVFIYTDYTIPVEPVREELKRIVGQSSDWDGQVCVLQVTNATEHTLELRALASASDASKAWDLRCEIREKLVAFVQKNFPESLPRVRGALQPASELPA